MIPNDASLFSWKYKLACFVIASMGVIYYLDGYSNPSQFLGSSLAPVIASAIVGLPVKGKRGLVFGLLLIFILAFFTWYGRQAYL